MPYPVVQVVGVVTFLLARLGDSLTSLQLGNSLDSHWLGYMTTAGRLLYCTL